MYERTLHNIDEAIRQLDDERRLIERELRALRQTRQAIAGADRSLRQVRRATVRGLDRAGRDVRAGGRQAAPRAPGRPGRASQVHGVPERTSARMIDAWKTYRAQREARS